MRENEIMMYEPADVVIYLSGRGLVLKEKSLLAFDRVTKKILAYGAGAENAAAAAPEDILIFSPLRQGKIVDYTAAVHLFSHLLHQVVGQRLLKKPAVAICVPKDTSEVEKKAMMDTFYQAGAKEVMITEIPAEQFIQDAPENSPKLSRKFQVVVGITKDDPESYIKEQLSHTLAYAAQTGISPERVAQLLSSAD